MALGYSLEQKVREGEYYLSNIAVYPEFRGLGLDTKMLEEMENRAKMLNCKSIILDVEVRNEKGPLKGLDYFVNSLNPLKGFSLKRNFFVVI